MRRLIVAVLFAAACGSAPPKPAELETLEQLRAQPVADEAAQRSPDEVKEVDRLKGKSWGAWKSGKLEDSRRDALMAWVQLKTVIAVVEQEQAKKRIEAADKELAGTEKEYARLAKDLGAVMEQINLLERLATAKSGAEKQRLEAEAEKQRMAGELANQQAKADTENKIAAAELALKTADTVNAAQYAKTEYSAANDNLARARSEAQAGNYTAAGTSADMAKAKAEAAENAARPQYQQNAEAKDRKTRDEALGRDAAGLQGVKVNIARQGEMTRLVLVFSGAFKSKQSTITPGKEAILDSLAALLKKYPTYPVQIIGYTDNKGKRDALMVVSQARAQAVFDALVSRGVDGKRFVVSGKGPDEPISDNKTGKGRDQNNRVEIVFLYQ